MLQGGCLCGYIRYETHATPSDATSCHCGVCRRVQAAACVSWFTVPSGDFHLTGSEPTRFASSEHATRSFCPRCGTALSFQRNDTLQEIDITTCSLDEPGHVPPRDQTHTRSKVAWVELDPKLPAFAEARSDG
ncbi:MAG: GFA family protein [Myxococcota bacterium]